jgi:hypothetical protein
MELYKPNEGDGIQDQEPHIREVDVIILKMFANEPFSLVRELSHCTYLSRSTIYQHFMVSLDFTIRHLR